MVDDKKNQDDFIGSIPISGGDDDAGVPLPPKVPLQPEHVGQPEQDSPIKEEKQSAHSEPETTSSESIAEDELTICNSYI